MTTVDLAIIVRGIGPALREYVSAAISPLVARLAAVEAKEKKADVAIVPAALPPRDGLPGVPGRDGAPGEKGADGLGFDDLSVLHDGMRGFTLRFHQGARVKDFAFTIPAMIIRGPFAEGKQYEHGDVVTYANALFHCCKATMIKPDYIAPRNDKNESLGPQGRDYWQLILKKPSDGKDGRDAPSLPVVKVGGPR